MVTINRHIRCRGAAAVEIALVFPLIVLLTLAVIEYSWLFLKAQQITTAAREGARAAIRQDSTNGDVLAIVDDRMQSAGMAGSGYDVDFSPGDVSSVEVGTAVNVRVSVPCSEILVINLSLLPTPTNLRASVTMAKEGP
jgi:Flp pilus assembly protein TadG